MERETCHFWVGHFKDEDTFFDFFEEDLNYYNEEEPGPNSYVSSFAASQSESWIDHDFMEYGFENGKDSLEKKFGTYSYAEKWFPALEKYIQEQGIGHINALVFVNKSEIEKPRSVNRTSFQLHYLGEIEYDI